jgi:cytochrome c-type protein NapC/trimethylamine-N-oxide reductase cytochrome c-type subunit TorC
MGWALGIFKRWGVPFLLGIAAAVICFLSINAAMKPFSTNTYCGTACHEMDTAYRSWELSVHGANARGIQVDCVECHLPPKEDYFTHLFAKAWTGGRDMYMHHFGPEYNGDEVRHKASEKMSNQTCAYCHEDLLSKPGNAKSRFAHQAAQLEPDKPENKCITCHEAAGHKRNATLFSP